MTSLLTETERTKFEKLEATAAKAAADRQALADSIADREGQWHSIVEGLAGLAAATKVARGIADHLSVEIEAHWGHARGTRGQRDTREHRRIVGELCSLEASRPILQKLAEEKEQELSAAIKTAKSRAGEMNIDRSHWPALLND